jgi:hypothetical protein
LRRLIFDQFESRLARENFRQRRGEIAGNAEQVLDFGFRVLDFTFCVFAVLRFGVKN